MGKLVWDMNAKEYEQYVAKLVQELECFKFGTVYTNRRYPGVRQPGQYEIDVAVEMSLGDVASFLLIIECKNWERRVDRPVIQKLAQTRDAIAAHKAAVVSPVGFTDESVQVAEVHGIALWVIAEKSWSVTHHLGGPRLWAEEYDNLRQSFLESLEIDVLEQPESAIVDFSAIEPGSSSSPENDQQLSFWPMQYEYWEDPSRPVDRDRRTAVSQIADAIFLQAKQSFDSEDTGITHKVKTWLARTEQYLIRAFENRIVSPEQAMQAAEAVAVSDEEAFYQALEPTIGMEPWLSWERVREGCWHDGYWRKKSG